LRAVCLRLSSLTAYGDPLSASLLRDFHGLSLNGLHSPWLVVVIIRPILCIKHFQLAEAILTEPTTHDDEVPSIHLANTRTWPERQQRLHAEERGERDLFLERDSEDEDEETGLKDQCQDSGAELGRSNYNGFVDVQNEAYVLIPGEQETSGGVNGVSRSNRAASSTLNSKAGIILGIHNIFIVIPQFLVTGLSAIIFAIFDPQKPLLPDHRAPIAPGPSLNGTMSSAHAVVARGKGVVESLLLENSVQGKDDWNNSSHPDSVVYIFRIGGVAACLAFLLCWRLAREIRHR